MKHTLAIGCLLLAALAAAYAFVSGFLAGISREKKLSDCVRLGNGAGTLCVGKVGASGTLPAFKELSAFIGSD